MAEDEELLDVEAEEIEVPVIIEGSYYYVCEQCGGSLTEIPLYNRYLCENCGLHY